jgi:hypothetical protein
MQLQLSINTGGHPKFNLIFSVQTNETLATEIGNHRLVGWGEGVVLPKPVEELPAVKQWLLDSCMVAEGLLLILDMFPYPALYQRYL